MHPAILLLIVLLLIVLACLIAVKFFGVKFGGMFDPDLGEEVQSYNLLHHNFDIKRICAKILKPPMDIYNPVNALYADSYLQTQRSDFDKYFTKHLNDILIDHTIDVSKVQGNYYIGMYMLIQSDKGYDMEFYIKYLGALETWYQFVPLEETECNFHYELLYFLEHTSIHNITIDPLINFGNRSLGYIDRNHAHFLINEVREALLAMEVKNNANTVTLKAQFNQHVVTY